MVSQIYTTLLGSDSRAAALKTSWAALGLSGKISRVSLADLYTVDAGLSHEQLEVSANALTNASLERNSVNEMPFKDGEYDYLIEIGFLPGVTDNVAHTVVETLSDTLHRPFGKDEHVYTSRVFFISGNLSYADIILISRALYNPLIERGAIFTSEEIAKKFGLPRVVPEVKLTKQVSVISVPLDVPDEELLEIGKQGVMGPDGVRRGPLALDLVSMKAIQAFFKTIKRAPTDIEIESLAQTWSEHCKHTIFANPIDDIKDGLYKTYIKGATNEIRKKKGKDDICVSVFSDNAGAIVFDKDFMVTHKVETHNSPSALDPFGGAITGIVGVNRDTIGFGKGAKPVANVYGFCFGNPEDTRQLFRDKNRTQEMLSPKRIAQGVIKGINAGGNCSGIPTISGMVRFDDRFRGKPLVFAGTVGISPMKVGGKPAHEKAAQPGDYIVVVGGRVGADGIHGATFSSTVMDTSSPATAVQIGDPITQKKLSDAIIKEARAMDLYTSITDNGAGGISCSVAEMAKECGGAIVELDKVPLKYPGLLPWQIWISESQERMTLSVPEKKWQMFERLMKRRGVEAVVVGTFTDSGNCVVRYEGKEIMNLPLAFLHDGLPKRDLKTAQAMQAQIAPTMPKGAVRTKEFLALLSTGNIGSFENISKQYDHEVQASSVIKPLSGRGRINTDAQVIRPVLTSHKGVVLSASTYPSYSEISAYDMAACAIDTAIRNSICVGGTLSHMAILDNFCWCSSTDPVRLGQLVESIRACYTYAVGFETPFISGKDSMFNDFRGYDKDGNQLLISVPPTLLISAISVMKDVNNAVPPEFQNAGDSIYILGETHNELGGSEYYRMLSHAGGDDMHTLGTVPVVDLAKNKVTYAALEKAIAKGTVISAQSVISGGLSAALAKASVGGMLGADINLDAVPGTAKDVDALLFSESQGRIILTVSSKKSAEFEKIMKGVSFAKIGKVRKDKKYAMTLNKKNIIATTVDALAKAYKGSQANSI